MNDANNNYRTLQDGTADLGATNGAKNSAVPPLTDPEFASIRITAKKSLPFLVGENLASELQFNDPQDALDRYVVAEDKRAITLRDYGRLTLITVNGALSLCQASKMMAPNIMAPSGLGISGNALCGIASWPTLAHDLLARIPHQDQAFIFGLLNQGGIGVDELNALFVGRDVDVSDVYFLAFCLYFFPRAVWDLLPFQFIRDAYAGFIKKHRLQTRKLKTPKIEAKLEVLMGWLFPEWIYPVRNKHNKFNGIRSGNGRMDKPEPMIIGLDIKNWMGPAGSLTRPKFKTHYTGLLKR